MRNYIYLTLLLLGGLLWAQDSEPKRLGKLPVVRGCQHLAHDKAATPACMTKMLTKELKNGLSFKALEHNAYKTRQLEVNIKVGFVVRKDRYISDIELKSGKVDTDTFLRIKAVLESLGEEFILKPGELEDGTPVNVSLNLPIVMDFRP